MSAGLIKDPAMDGGHDVHAGLRIARQLLLDIVALGVPSTGAVRPSTVTRSSA